MKKSVLTANTEKKDTLPPYEESLNQLKKQKRVCNTLCGLQRIRVLENLEHLKLN